MAALWDILQKTAHYKKTVWRTFRPNARICRPGVGSDIDSRIFDERQALDAHRFFHINLQKRRSILLLCEIHELLQIGLFPTANQPAICVPSLTNGRGSSFAFRIGTGAIQADRNAYYYRVGEDNRKYSCEKHGAYADRRSHRSLFWLIFNALTAVRTCLRRCTNLLIAVEAFSDQGHLLTRAGCLSFILVFACRCSSYR
jgi:hypothetical protein